MFYFLKLFACAFIGFVAIDAIWLAFVANSFYKRHLGFLLSDQPNWWAAILFYPLFVAGVIVFAVLPGLQSGSWVKSLALGSFFGLVAYATYDLTNLATIKNWPWIITAVDLVWGTVLAGAVSVIGYFAGRWLA